MTTNENTTVPILRSQRLVLRPMAMSDLAAYHALQFDSGATRFGPAQPKSLQDSEGRLARVLARHASGELMNWCIADEIDRPMFGFIGLVRIAHVHRRSEVAYQLRSDRWGAGIMTEALDRVVEYAFETLDFHRLEGHTHPQNLPSIGVLQRCGFTYEGILRENYLLDGAFHDSAVYAKLAPRGSTSSSD